MIDCFMRSDFSANMEALLSLELRVGYYFRNKVLLFEALLHPSFGFKMHNRSVSYERMEFLGDSVLNLAISDLLYNTYPSDREGGLARKKVALVCGGRVAEVGNRIGIGEFILMASGEKVCGGASNLNNVENATEALIGAIYLDGGFEKSKEFVEKYWGSWIENMLDPPVDSKSLLQEWAQKNNSELPAYVVVQKSGDDHKPVFLVSVTLSSHGVVHASGFSKKAAERMAAELMLKRVMGTSGTSA